MIGVPKTYIVTKATAPNTYRTIGVTADGRTVNAITFSFTSDREPTTIYSFYFDSNGRPVKKIDTIGTMPYAPIVHEDFAYEFEAIARQSFDKYLANQSTIDNSVAQAMIPVRLHRSLEKCVSGLLHRQSKAA